MHDFSDITDNIETIKERAAQGDADAQNKIGVCYQLGLSDFPKDFVKAVEWYTKSAMQGFTMAQFNLAYCYLNGMGVKEDAKAGVEWFIKIAEQGNIEAMNNVGFSYETGMGVEKDYNKALEWYTKAAELGDETALEEACIKTRRGFIIRRARYMSRYTEPRNSFCLQMSGAKLSTFF